MYLFISIQVEEKSEVRRDSIITTEEKISKDNDTKVTKKTVSKVEEKSDSRRSSTVEDDKKKVLYKIYFLLIKFIFCFKIWLILSG